MGRTIFRGRVNGNDRARKDRPRQLLRRQLSALLVLEADLPARGPRRPRRRRREPGTPLGLYLHIPFCRKRCKFCYFRVYTDKNARDVETYTDALVKEVALYARQPFVGGRPLNYVYFGGGTPSYLSAGQLRDLMTPAPGRPALGRRRGGDVRVRAGHAAAAQAGDAARAGRDAPQPRHRELRPEDPRVQRPGAPRRGDPPRLRLGARARLRADQHRPHRRHGRRDVGQLAASASPRRSPCAPDSVTIYQMELPYNTVFSQAAEGGRPGRAGHGDRRLADQARLGRVRLRHDDGGRLRDLQRLHAGARQGRASSSTATPCGTGPTCSAPASPRSATSAASTCRTSIAGRTTSALLDRDELPLGRALPVTPHQRAHPRDDPATQDGPRSTRGYFQKKFGVDVRDEFADGWRRLEEDGKVTQEGGEIAVTPEGMLRRRSAAADVLRAGAPGESLHLIAGAKGAARWRNSITARSGSSRRRARQLARIAGIECATWEPLESTLPITVELLADRAFLASNADRAVRRVLRVLHDLGRRGVRGTSSPSRRLLSRREKLPDGVRPGRPPTGKVHAAEGPHPTRGRRGDPAVRAARRSAPLARDTRTLVGRRNRG